MLESHHLVIEALQKLYKYCINKEPFPGGPVETVDGYPLTHAILDRLGLIKQAEGNQEKQDKDLEDLQYSGGVGGGGGNEGGGSWKWDYHLDQYPSNSHTTSGYNDTNGIVLTHVSPPPPQTDHSYLYRSISVNFPLPN